MFNLCVTQSDFINYRFALKLAIKLLNTVVSFRSFRDPDFRGLGSFGKRVRVSANIKR